MKADGLVSWETFLLCIANPLRNKMSQSVSFGTNTSWFPLVLSVSATAEVMTASQQHFQGVVSIVSNLPAPQSSLFFSQTTPFAFVPHVGLFVSEFAIGTALSK